MIKEQADPFGPWSSVRYPAERPELLLSRWPFKSAYFEMTTLLQADWYIIPQQDPRSWFARRVALYAPERQRLFDAYVTGITALSSIPLDAYDVILCFNPMIRPPRASKALFTYFLHEHVDPLYPRSLKRVRFGFDLFLDHLMHSAPEVFSLPQSLRFPYLRNPKLVRSVAGVSKEDAVWLDAKTVMWMSGDSSLWTDRSERSAHELSGRWGLPLRVRRQLYRGFWRIEDPPRWTDALEYLADLGKCRYFVSLSTGGAGQALTDAASLGCICIGSDKLAYHRMVCHPVLLCRDMGQAEHRLRQVIRSPQLQQEVVDWQNRMLEARFAQEPLALLERAVRLKQSGLVPEGIATARKGFWTGASLCTFHAEHLRRRLEHHLKQA